MIIRTRQGKVSFFVNLLRDGIEIMMHLENLLGDQPIWWAVFISIAANIGVSIAGVLPSAAITAANIIVFGFWPGFLLSIIGESIGAVLSFLLYRKGVQAIHHKKMFEHRSLQWLAKTKGRQAFWLIIALRIFPFMPSGLVTLASAMSQIQWWVFALASTLGKLPALLMEALLVHGIMQTGFGLQILLVMVSCFVLFIVLRKRKIV